MERFITLHNALSGGGDSLDEKMHISGARNEIYFSGGRFEVYGTTFDAPISAELRPIPPLQN